MKYTFKPNNIILFCVIFITTLSIGCGVTRKVIYVKHPTKQFVTAAIVPQDGNSPEMDSHLRNNIIANKITVRPSLPAGTRKSEEADLLISYGDAWTWDMVMYLRNISITITEGKTGDLLVTGYFNNSSAFHAYPSAEKIVCSLFTEMIQKLQQGEKTELVNQDKKAASE